MKPEMTAKRAQTIARLITKNIPNQFEIATELLAAYHDGVSNGIYFLARNMKVKS